MPTPRPDLHRLPPYSPGRPLELVRAETGRRDLIKLASNESLWGPSPRALAAARDALHDIIFYPLIDPAALKRAIAESAGHGLTPAHIVVGNGGDELLRLVAQAYLAPGRSAVLPTPSFSAYRFAVLLAGATPLEVPLDPQTGAMDLDAMAAAVRPDTTCLFLCNPNNPTGAIFGADAWARFIERIPPQVLVVVDEAYHEFADQPDYPDTLADVAAGRPVLHLRTFSKLHALAGLRIAWAAADPAVVAALLRTQDPFSVNRVAMAAAEASLADTAYLQQVRAETLAARRWLETALTAEEIAFRPSQANFVLIDSGREAAGLARALEYEGVIVRACGSFGLPRHLRVTVAPVPLLQRFLEAWRSVAGRSHPA